MTAIVATNVTIAMGVGLYLGGRYGKKMRNQISHIIGNAVSAAVMQGIVGYGQSQISEQEKNFTEQLLREQNHYAHGTAP